VLITYLDLVRIFLTVFLVDVALDLNLIKFLLKFSNKLPMECPALGRTCMLLALARVAVLHWQA